MTMQNMMLTAIIFLFLIAGAVHAEPPPFQNSADEIIDALTREPEPMRTRSMSRTLTRSYGDAPRYRTIVVKERQEHQTVKETLTIDLERQEPTAFLKIEFDFDSYRLRPGSYPLLNELGKALTSEKLREMSFYVNGHTDSDGPLEYNLDLSLNRAQAVKDYLVGSFNIPPERLTIRGFGEAMPLVENTTAENKQMNRRVEIRLAR